jgi:hypothetical protein
MAQIIRHRKGVLESVASATKRKAELLIVTGSSGITATNADSLIFFGDGTGVSAANKVLYGTSTPNLSGASYDTSVDGIPFYNTSEEKLYILAKAGNTEVKSTANTGGTDIISGSAGIVDNIASQDVVLGGISGSSLDITGNTKIDGNLVLGGNITIGDASSDTIAFGGDITTDIIPNANNTLDLGSATDKFAEVHATTLFGAINATNGIVSGSSQVFSDITGDVTIDSSGVSTIGAIKVLNGMIADDAVGADELGANAVVNASVAANAAIANSKIDFGGSTLHSGSGQVVDSLLNQATDFGSGRVSADDFGDVAGTSTFTGSFVGDGAGLTGLATDLQVSDGSSSNLLDLQNDAIRIVPVANETTVDLYSVGALKGWTVGIADNPTLTGDVTVTGDLTVSGTTTTVDSETLNISGSIIRANYGGGAVNGGLEVSDATGTLATGSFLWDGTNDYWKGGALGAELQFATVTGTETLTNKTIDGSQLVNASVANTKLANDGITIAGVDTDLGGTITASTIGLAIGTLVSGSSQVTTEAAASEILIKHASNGSIDGASVYSAPATSTIAINDSTPSSIGTSGELIINGTTSGFSGVLTQDIAGTTTYSQYATSGDSLVNFMASSGYGLYFSVDGDTKSWTIDTDGDLVAGGNYDVYAQDFRATGDISGSNLKLTGNAVIDGDITLGGNITLGDATGDSINFGGELATDIIPDVNDAVDLGSSSRVFAEIHGTVVNATTFKAASGNVISGSAQLLNVATDFGSGRVSGDNFGDAAGGSTFTGSFVGDGSGISGLSTDLSVSGSDGSNDTVALLDGALTFAGGTGVSTAVATDTVTISVQDGSTSAKGIASFSSTNFGVSSGNVSLISGNGVDSSGGVLGANLNADVAGTGLTYSLSNQEIDVDYGSATGTAVQGNTTISVSGTSNEIEITGTTAQALGGGASYTIGLPDDVTIGNELTVTSHASVGGNLTVTGNLSVEGTTTTIDSTTVQIGDRVLELNYGGAAGNAGLLVSDATGAGVVSGSLLWDATNDNWTGGALGSEKEFARLNASPTTNTVLKADSNGLLVDSVLTDDGTDATFSGDLIVGGLTANSFIYANASKQLTAVTPSNAGDVIQWNGSSFVASNDLDGGTF